MHVRSALLVGACVLLAAGCSSTRLGGDDAPEAGVSTTSTTLAGTSVTKIENLAYGPAVPGNLLDLYLPDVPGGSPVPLVIWNSGSGWYSNSVKGDDQAVSVAEELTARGYAVASIDIRSSSDAPFPAQGCDVRAAIRWLREHSGEYGVDPTRFAFMGASSGGWSAAFAATTSDLRRLPGEAGVGGTSSAVQVAVSFFPPTDFLSMDAFAAEHDLPMSPEVYPHDAPGSPEGRLIRCPGEAVGKPLVSIQDCPAQAEAADPSTYVEGAEIPIWLLHGLSDPTVPYNQSQLVYTATTDAGNEARLTLVKGAEHSVDDIIDADDATTWVTNRRGQENVIEGTGPSWDDLDRFLRENLDR